MINKAIEYGNTTIQMYRDQTTQAIDTLTTKNDVDVIVEEEQTTEI